MKILLVIIILVMIFNCLSSYVDSNLSGTLGWFSAMCFAITTLLYEIKNNLKD